MTKKEYFRILSNWRRQYPTRRYGLDFLHSAIKECLTCGAKKDLNRHHKGCDFTFAIMMPEKFAKRYIEFNEEDCITLCRKCHKNCHIHIDKLKTEMWIDKRRLFDNHEVNVTEGWCNEWRQKFIVETDKWIIHRKDYIKKWRQRVNTSRVKVRKGKSR